jgi:hypothetical protein
VVCRELGTVDRVDDRRGSAVLRRADGGAANVREREENAVRFWLVVIVVWLSLLTLWVLS